MANFICIGTAYPIKRKIKIKRKRKFIIKYIFKYSDEWIAFTKADKPFIWRMSYAKEE